jgi:hypothetical protein
MNSTGIIGTHLKGQFHEIFDPRLFSSINPTLVMAYGCEFAKKFANISDSAL